VDVGTTLLVLRKKTQLKGKTDGGAEQLCARSFLLEGGVFEKMPKR